MTGKMLFLSIVWLHSSWWRCSTPHCRAEGDCGQAQWVQEKRETPCKQHAWNGNVERQPSSKCHVSWCAVLCRGLTYSGLVFFNVAPQKWNSQSAAKAQKWASHCSKLPAHSPDDSRRIGSKFTLANFWSQNATSPPKKTISLKLYQSCFISFEGKKCLSLFTETGIFFVLLVSDARTLKALNDLELSF